MESVTLHRPDQAEPACHPQSAADPGGGSHPAGPHPVLPTENMSSAPSLLLLPTRQSCHLHCHLSVLPTGRENRSLALQAALSL